MASVNVNSGVFVNTAVKLTRGKPVNLGTLAAAGNVVVFTVPEPSRDHQGNIVIQVSPGTLNTPTFALEASIDGGTSYAVVAGTTLTLTGQPGGDTAAAFMTQYNLSGFGAGTLFKFGLVTLTSGSGSAWALCG